VQIKGYDSKGTQFFRFTTPIAQDISHVAVAGTSLFVFTDFSMTIFDETAERCCYASPDRINAVAILPLGGPTSWWPLIACQSRVVRVLNDKVVVQVRFHLM
jgi:hypothetical protein